MKKRLLAILTAASLLLSGCAGASPNEKLNYTTNKDSLEAHIEGCSITLTPLLLLESANNLGHIAGEISKVGSEISYSRCENIKNGEATREQLCSLASGNIQKIHPNYSDIPLQLESKKV